MKTNLRAAVALVFTVSVCLCGCDDEVAVCKWYQASGWCEDGCNSVKVKWGDGTQSNGTSTNETKEKDGKTYRKWTAAHAYATAADDRVVECTCGGTTWHTVATVDVKAPTGETVETAGWKPSNPTVSQFDAQLEPTSIDFSTLGVYESPLSGATDSCWFQESINPAAISGGVWPVGTNNWWGPDNVGWPSNVVTFYRNEGRAPCGASVPLTMKLYCNNTSYANQTLGFNITQTQVSNSKGGKTLTKTWP